MTQVAKPVRTGGPDGRPRARSERGLASGLVAAGLLLLSVFVGAGLVALLLQVTAHRVQGAADLVALTAAQAKNLGTGEACAAASRAATADDVALVECRVGGGELAFVVTVTVRGGSGRSLLGLPLLAQATSHAGVPAGP